MLRDVGFCAVTNQPFDRQRVGAGVVQEGGEGMAAPVRRGAGGADLPGDDGEELPVEVRRQRGAVLLAEDGLAAAGEPGLQIGADFRVNRDDPVLAGGGLCAALQIVPIRMIGEGRERQELGDAEAGITEHQGGVRPGLPGGGQLLQTVELKLREGVPALLCADGGDLQIDGIVLLEDVALGGIAAQGLDEQGVVVDEGLGEPGVLIGIQDALPLVQGDGADAAVRKAGDALPPGGVVALDGGGLQLPVFPGAPGLEHLAEGGEGDIPERGPALGHAAVIGLQGGLGFGGPLVAAEDALDDMPGGIPDGDPDGPGPAAGAGELHDVSGSIGAFHGRTPPRTKKSDPRNQPALRLRMSKAIKSVKKITHTASAIVRCLMRASALASWAFREAI